MSSNQNPSAEASNAPRHKAASDRAKQQRHTRSASLVQARHSSSSRRTVQNDATNSHQKLESRYPPHIKHNHHASLASNSSNTHTLTNHALPKHVLTKHTSSSESSQTHRNPPSSAPHEVTFAPPKRFEEHTCCGVVQESAARARERRYAQDVQPHPWIVLKMVVAFTLGIMGYAAYVYIGLLVVPMIQRKADAAAGRGTGIGLLVPFSLFYLWMVWAYIRIISTSPGYARDHVQKTPKPLLPPSPYERVYPIDEHNTGNIDPEMGTNVSADTRDTQTIGRHIGGPSYEDMSRMMKAADPNIHTVTSPEINPTPWTAALAAPTQMERSASMVTVKSLKSVQSGRSRGSSLGQIRFNAGEMVNPSRSQEEGAKILERPEEAANDVQRSSREVQSGGNKSTRAHGSSSNNLMSRPSTAGSSSMFPPSSIPEVQAGVLDAPLGTAAPTKHRKRKRPAAAFPLALLSCFSGRQGHDPSDSWESDKTGPSSSSAKRKKPVQPTVYISRRPPSTPVLNPAHRYCDREGFVKPYRTHHCRNCGTCVLKYDHHCPWIGQCVGARNHKFFVNFCLAAFVFTAYVFGTLLPFTIKNFNSRGSSVDPQQIVIIALSALFAIFTFALTTSHVRMIMKGQTTVEALRISSMKSRERSQLAKAFKWWQVSAKKQTLQEWDEEWGRLDTEGNIWWIGPARREWEEVMGKNWLGWILPIGHSPSDGLNYPVNPRFDHEGRLRRREVWPREYR